MCSNHLKFTYHIYQYLLLHVQNAGIGVLVHIYDRFLNDSLCFYTYLVILYPNISWKAANKIVYSQPTNSIIESIPTINISYR